MATKLHSNTKMPKTLKPKLKHSAKTMKSRMTMLRRTSINGGSGSGDSDAGKLLPELKYYTIEESKKLDGMILYFNTVYKNMQRYTAPASSGGNNNYALARSMLASSNQHRKMNGNIALYMAKSELGTIDDLLKTRELYDKWYKLRGEDTTTAKYAFDEKLSKLLTENMPHLQKAVAEFPYLYPEYKPKSRSMFPSIPSDEIGELPETPNTKLKAPPTKYKLYFEKAHIFKAILDHIRTLPPSVIGTIEKRDINLYLDITQPKAPSYAGQKDYVPLLTAGISRLEAIKNKYENKYENKYGKK